jgi:hypothetical protein
MSLHPFLRGELQMRPLLAFVSFVVLVSPACSGDSESSQPTTPVSATPAPAPAPPTPSPPPTISITGTITDAVTGGMVGWFAATTTTFPARVMVSAPG